VQYQPSRFTKVSWIWPSDLDEGRRCAWDYDKGDEKVTCWPVSLYDPKCSSRSEYLIIHAVRGNGNDGGEIALACSNTPHFDWYAQVSMGIAVQSGPTRHPYRDNAEFWKEQR
jgi:hypothetical protein